MTVDYNRQYIGARYVPKLYQASDGSAKWEVNTSYEPLTIVTYGAASYTSRSQVPANIGNPASNPTYWVRTSEFNGHIAELENYIRNYTQITVGYVNNINDVPGLSVGMYVRTLNYSTINDGGGLDYVITQRSEIGSVPLTSGLFATPIFGSYINIASLGAKGNDPAFDNASVIQLAIRLAKDFHIPIFIPSNRYWVLTTVNVNYGVTFYGNYSKENDADKSSPNSLVGSNITMFSLTNGTVNFKNLNILMTGGTAIKIDCWRSTIENCYFEGEERAIYLAASGAFKYENIIKNNYFYNCHMAIYSEYVNGVVTDGMIIENIIASAGTESYFITGTNLSLYYIAGNHDYSTKGVELANVQGLQFIGNYFDNGNNTSLFLGLVGDVAIVGNMFLLSGQTGGPGKINLNNLVEEYRYQAVVSGNILFPVSAETAQTPLLMGTAQTYVSANAVGTNPLFTENVRNNIWDKGNVVRKDVTSLYKPSENITFNHIIVYEVMGVHYVAIELTVNATITGHSQSIYSTAPIALAAQTVTQMHVCEDQDHEFLYVNSGTALICRQQLNEGDHLFIHYSYIPA